MAHKMWGGRFHQSPDSIMEEINASIDFDQRLAMQDIAGSRAHCAMLIKTNIITKEDGEKILKGLTQIETEIQQGEFQFSRALEDIHMNIESRLSDLIGDAAGRLHTARSRNDQVATDFKLYIRETVGHLEEQIHNLQHILAKKAKQYADIIMPGFTHLQTAQAITYGHHLLAYVEMLARDRTRFLDAKKRMNDSPLGAAALAGTPFPIDRNQTAEALGFDKPMDNSIDSVSDRDFVLEALSCASITAIHLSRLAEEIVIFSSAQFNFFKLPDSFSTGSSIMPQKRNPDAAELIRAKTGGIIGNLTSLMIVMKGLPLAYSKDMQEDKCVAFDAFDNLSLCLAAMAGMMDQIKPQKEQMLASAMGGFSTATDLADWLVSTINLPFREAHHITGELVAHAEKENINLENIPLEVMQKVEPRITKSIYTVLGVHNSVESRKSHGGTNPNQVLKAAEKWIVKLETVTK